MVEEILRPGDTHISLLLKTVVESSMFFRAVSIRSISLTLKSNGDNPRILQILKKKKRMHCLTVCFSACIPLLFRNSLTSSYIELILVHFGANTLAK